MLRNIIFYILLIPLSIYFSVRMLRLDPETSTKKEEDYPSMGWARLMLKIIRPKLEVDISALTPGQQYVFMANHQSNFDIPLLTHNLRDYSVRYVAKKSLFSIPFFGPAMHRAGNVCVDRSNRRAAMQSLSAAVEQIHKTGISPIVFPEGTRSTNLDELMEFKIGGIVLALKCGLPVAPVVLCGSGRLLPKGCLRFRLSEKVRIKALPPIDLTEWDVKRREEFMTMLRERMDAAYQEMRRAA